LNWFFNGTSIDVEDLHRSRSVGYEDEDAWTEDDRIEVTVRFTDLDTDDRAVLGKYGKGESAWFRRSWHPVDGEKKIGNALQGPGFADVRSKPNVEEMKAAYVELREVVEGHAERIRDHPQQSIRSTANSSELTPPNPGQTSLQESQGEPH
jgi:hypothetical protein